VILIGRDAPIIAATLSAAGLRPCFADDMSHAVALAADLAQPGDSVLLSPACASFDMFKSYEERGAVFAAEVKERTEC
jgi:UDP-N-acetylmuramoylalanine--D-glutamate ligase